MKGDVMREVWRQAPGDGLLGDGAPVAEDPDGSQGREAAVRLLAGIFFLAPALGSFNQYLVQGTLKSAILACGSLGCAFLWLMAWRKMPTRLSGHWSMGIPLLLLVYALGSMVWSHPHLAGEAAGRWFMVLGLMALVINAVSLRQLPELAWGVHGGAVAATVWAALQFWGDLSWFPQGPAPGSTFLNRNFYAEYVVCSLPFGGFLLMQAQTRRMAVALGASLAFVVVGVMMTGMRTAQLALLAGALAGGAWGWRCRSALIRGFRERGGPALAAALVVLLTLGNLPSGQAKVIDESGGRATPVERLWVRAQTVTDRQEYTERSFSKRLTMWRDTWRMIQAHPVTGVGSGAWEVHLPLYQEESAQMETDYRAHNEFIQLVAECGWVGWIVVAMLLFWAVRAIQGLLRLPPLGTQAQAGWAVLTSLGMLLIFSLTGFPWQMACTLGLGALNLGVWAMLDNSQPPESRIPPATTGTTPRWLQPTLPWGAGLLLLGSGYLAVQTMAVERKYIKAMNLAHTVSASGNPNSPQWLPIREEILVTLQEAIAASPHQRFITPRIADELAAWGDWKNAIAVWESILPSRPYLFGVIANVARGYLVLGDLPRAQQYLDRLRQLRPADPSLRALELVVLLKQGQHVQAIQRIEALLQRGTHDPEFLRTAYSVASELKAGGLVVRILQSIATSMPDQAGAAYLEQARWYVQDPALRNDEAALAAFRHALAATPADRQPEVMQAIPVHLRPRI